MRFSGMKMGVKGDPLGSCAPGNPSTGRLRDEKVDQIDKPGSAGNGERCEHCRRGSPRTAQLADDQRTTVSRFKIAVG